MYYNWFLLYVDTYLHLVTNIKVIILLSSNTLDFWWGQCSYKSMIVNNDV